MNSWCLTSSYELEITPSKFERVWDPGVPYRSRGKVHIAPHMVPPGSTFGTARSTQSLRDKTLNLAICRGSLCACSTCNTFNFAMARLATLSIVLSASLCVRAWENLGHETIGCA